MKIVLDLSELVETGRITPAEADRLRSLAAFTARSLAVNLLVGFGLIAVVAGFGALVPSATTAIALGAIALTAGLLITRTGARDWELLGQMCAVAGALALCSGLAVLDGGSLRSILFGVVLLLVVAVPMRSGLLVAIAVLAIGACLGSSTDYRHALYTVSIEEPTLTVVVFSAIAVLAYVLSLRLSAARERLALIAARVAVLTVNFGFWVGSLWGDDLGRLRSWLGQARERLPDTAPAIPAGAFGLAWAVALVAVAAWAFHARRLWIVNTAAVFGAIHFYTQWFEKLGPIPVAVLVGGVLVLVFAFGLWRLNQAQQVQIPA